ncbi:PPR_2 domain-containing protein [Cephalotus follicularis]|uniref:PPR_2 domain-containing protein n=1 Tax=Cephalotus follicularis TaxID=3775 RepID=A0A1Q3B864_CEPFO|nr:PPR_2 domain-containing protein [Cephalotus follicularis]
MLLASVAKRGANIISTTTKSRGRGNDIFFTISTSNSLLAVSPLFRAFSSSASSNRKVHFSGIDDALASFHGMLRMHPRPHVVQFTKVLTSLVKFKQYAAVVSLCKRMESLGIKHDVYTVTVLINCFCRLFHLHFGFSILGKMLNLGLEPSTVTSNTLINGLCVWGSNSFKR